MKPHSQFLAASIAIVLAITGNQPAHAQATPTAADQKEAISSLSFHDKMELMRARKQVFADNPDLQAEQQKLEQQGNALKSEGSAASPKDKIAFAKSFEAHEKKMKAALLQVDPNLQPVLEKVDQLVKQKVQARAAQAGN